MKKIICFVSLLFVLSINAQNFEFINCIIQNDCVKSDTIHQQLIQNGKFILKDIYFDLSGKIYLEYESYNKLDTLVNCLKQNATINILITAHTDSRGSDTYNLQFSENCANVVMKALIDKGISHDRLKAEGRGKRQPLVSEETIEDKAINRRIEIEIIDNLIEE